MAEKQNDGFENHVLGTLYGNCIGDAIGLLTEFMSKPEAESYYKKFVKGSGLEYDQKVPDMHRARWELGDWTDDSDQMILIIDSILDKKGKVDAADYAGKLDHWIHRGFPELGDHGGLGIGATTYKVVRHHQFKTEPHVAANDIWEGSGQFVAPNGAVMRTSILGIYECGDIEKVKTNTLEICKVTHADPRCQASCIAVTCAIAFMLSRDAKYYNETKHKFNVDAICDAAFEEAKKCFRGLEGEESFVKELKDHMYAKKLKELKLDEHNKIGYTFKTLGAGFWAFRETDFKAAITELVMEAGDADTNGAVAGALLGCKLGVKALPDKWLSRLCHKEWLDNKISRFMGLAFPNVKLSLLQQSMNTDHVENQFLGTLYGHCVGDAIGLLTEFMSKADAHKHYTRVDEAGKIELTYDQKVYDNHRNGWVTGDWTDDTDQMILIMDSLLESKTDYVNVANYARRLKEWAKYGFRELGDTIGVGLGATTSHVLRHQVYDKNSHDAAEDIWKKTGCDAAPNGAVMRTSILGLYKYKNIYRVKQNTLRVCRVTHADPRCQASCVAVTSAIAFMLQRSARHFNAECNEYLIELIVEDAYNEAVKCVENEKHIKELKKHMYAKTLEDLKLDAKDSMGYTYKTLGAGFWALRQHNYKTAITEIVMEGGDADTNCAVAGALLGCKLGYSNLGENIPDWMFNLKHKKWFDEKITRFFKLAFPDITASRLETTSPEKPKAESSDRIQKSEPDVERSSVTQKLEKRSNEKECNE